MQIDIWLTQSAQPTQCPLCSKPLKASSKTCYACGFSLESPTSTGSSVWIDPAVYTYQPPESASTSAQPSERSKELPNPPKPVKPTGSVVWEGATWPQSQPQTGQHTGGTSIPSPSKHTSPISKSVAKPVHTRRRTYTRSLSQTQEGNPSARSSAPQPPMWQYESPNFEAGSSLPTLSLLVAETPTQPGIALPERDAQPSEFRSSPIPTEDSWIVGTVEADLRADTRSSTPLHTTPAPTGFPDLPPRSTPRTRRLPDIAGIADITAIDEIDTVPPLLERRSHELPTDDSFLISGSSLISNAVSAAEPTEDAPAPSRTREASHTPYAHVDLIDTVPDLNQAPHISYAQVDQIDTLPELEQAPSRALVPIKSQVATIPATDSSSWTAGGSAQSSYARRIADRTPPKKRHTGLSLNPFDTVRWWLLRPGRIEFILWLGGTILLISVTCVLLLVTAFSLNWITPGLRSSVTSSATSLTGTTPQGHVLPTITGAPGLVFTLLDKDHIFLSGQSVHVHGQGFSRNGKVDFTLDGPQLPLNPNAPPASVQADMHGGFNATLLLGYGIAPGLHLIIAHDMSTDRLAVLSFTITQAPFGKGATATPAPAAPGATVTPTPGSVGGGGGNPATPTPPISGTPVNTTPVPPTPTPTVGITPTPTKVPPTPTPTVGVTPSPTPGKTPTPSTSPTAAVPPTSSPTAAASPTAAVPLSSALSGDSGPGALSNALGNSNTPALSAQLTRLAPWLWLPMSFYTLSMLMLGIAGILHKRRR